MLSDFRDGLFVHRPVRLAQPLRDTLSNAWAAREREWWLLKYAETGRSPHQQGEKKGGKGEKEELVEQTCLGVSLPYMVTCVKLPHDLIMFRGCWHCFHGKVHVNVLTDCFHFAVSLSQ